MKHASRQLPASRRTTGTPRTLATSMIVCASLALTACAYSTSSGAGPGASVQRVEDALFPGFPRADEGTNVRTFAAPPRRSPAFERLYGREGKPSRAPSAATPLSESLARERSAPNLLHFRF